MRGDVRQRLSSFVRVDAGLVVAGGLVMFGVLMPDGLGWVFGWPILLGAAVAIARRARRRTEPLSIARR